MEEKFKKLNQDYWQSLSHQIRTLSMLMANKPNRAALNRLERTVTKMFEIAHFQSYEAENWKANAYNIYGAIIGDIIGSRFEFDNIKNKDFELFAGEACYFTDDTVMTIAVMKSLLDSCEAREDEDYYDLSEHVIKNFKTLGLKHIDAGYGRMFLNWLLDAKSTPYDSYGNGAAMRISPVGYAATFIDEAKELSLKITSVTHNHPKGVAGAEAVAVATYMATNAPYYDKGDIKRAVEDYYNLDFTLDEIRDNYKFDETCDGTIPVAIVAFLESCDFEDAIRNAVSVGGDSDTIAAITGGIAGAYYGVPKEFVDKAKKYLTDEMIDIIEQFSRKFWL